MSHNPYESPRESPIAANRLRMGWLLVMILPIGYVAAACFAAGSQSVYEAGYQCGNDCYLSQQQQRKQRFEALGHDQALAARIVHGCIKPIF